MKIHRKAYMLCPKACPDDGFKTKYELTSMYELRCGKDTEIRSLVQGEHAVYLIGVFVHCQDADILDDQILQELIRCADDVQKAVKYTSLLAGHFLVILVNQEQIYVLPDACTTYCTAYTQLNGVSYAASNPKIIADLFHIPISLKMQDMKENTNIGEALPNNKTLYEGIVVMLPNHYLDFNTGRTCRVYPCMWQGEKKVDQIGKDSACILQTIIQGLLKKKSLSLPLTGGVDSRTILAAIGKERADQVVYYTYRHEHDGMNIGDIKIPQKITSEYGLEYQLIDLVAASEQEMGYYQKEIEEDSEVFTPNLCSTYRRSRNAGRCFLSGGIAPIGKSVYGNTLPECLCIPSYLLTKAHNSSFSAYKEIKEWMREIKPYCKKYNISIFDMFYWEYRCGRWDQRTHLYTDAMIEMVSPYNCAYLLQMWLLVPRAMRQKKYIHTQIIEQCWPELNTYPLNPDSWMYVWVKRHPYVYWVLSYILWAKESILRKKKLLMRHICG